MTDIVERLRAATRDAIAEIERLRNKHQEPIIDRAFLDTPLSEISFGRLLNARVHNITRCEFENGTVRYVPITTVRDLDTTTEAELLRGPNVGRQTIESIKAVLAEHNLYLGMKIDVASIG
jgi:DNA-directed RNA polymerase alpha subunit